ncbi:MAG: L,D-transpeptidase family protein, partial [Alphaproteobacteria bacterium]|nr:L,D-transpeptidase family protein [Alphaproteobacteria bacterium]
QSKDIPATLRALAPRGELYRKLQAALAEQSMEAAKYDHLLPLKFGGAYMFKPGQSHKDVPKMREFLKVEYNPERGPENYYDDNLASVVMDFQRERNLEPDGIIGPETMRVMNKSHEDTMKQIVANLERLRWLDEERPDRYIMVNIPSQRLWAIENGNVAVEMNVIVGLPSRQTKQFKTEVTGVRFNPTWTVPLSLKMADFKPKLVNNPGYLHEKGIQVYQNGRTLDPYAIDWANVNWKEMNTLRFTQKPGDHNALGKVRILMPSDYDIYLHDTNHPEFFEKTQRALSSGCVRMSDPEAVARFILKHNADWSDEKMKELIDRGKLVEVQSERPFPVYIVYQSIWLDEAGTLVYGPDIYNQDQKLTDLLARAGGYALPEKKDHEDTADAGGAQAVLAAAQ